jgi:hypothetical protein
MKNWLSNWRNRREPNVEAELRAARPQASARFVKSIAARVNPRPVQPVRTRTRLGLAAAVTLTMLAVVGATGGFSSAASSILGATHSVTHFTAPPTPPTTRPGTTGGGRTSAGDEYAHAPTITGFSPGFGKVGTSVTVTGTNFAGLSAITSVTLNGTNAGYSINSSTSLTFTVPEGATSGTITVKNSADSATSSGTFTVVVAPSITNLTPSSGGAGTDVTITGSNFTGSTKVTFNNRSASFSITDDSHISASVPANAPAKAGSVVVTNPAGSSNAAAFTVLSGAPTVQTFTPGFGKVDDTITVKGTNFTNVSAVLFNGTPGTNVTPGTGTSAGKQLTVKVPGGATTGPITVVNDKGDGTSKGNFLVVGTPVINSFSPTAGKPAVGSKPGTPVTISGLSFTGTTSVSFNGHAASFKVKGDTKITTSVPAGATTGPITITNASGPTDSSDDFTVVTTVPAPTGVTPGTGGAGTDVVISGTNLDDITGVTFNGKAAQFEAVNATTLDATVPVGAPKGPGTGAKAGIQVSNAFGTSASVSFTVLDTAPTITTLKVSGKPASQGFIGDTVTLGGTHLDTVDHVTFGGGTQSTVNHISATSISVAIPGGATTGAVTAFNPSGDGSAKGTFTILGTPSILGFTPAYGKKGTKVTIVGTNFAGATEVDFGGVSAGKPILNKDGSLSATVPKNAVSGPVTVKVGALHSDSGNDHFTIVTKPNATGGPATAARGAQITITGSGFAGTTSVKVGALSAAYSVLSDGSIKVTIPAHAVTGTNKMITITNAAGSGTFKLTIT